MDAVAEAYQLFGAGGLQLCNTFLQQLDFSQTACGGGVGVMSPKF